jgi:hypothetical protein
MTANNNLGWVPTPREQAAIDRLEATGVTVLAIPKGANDQVIDQILDGY